MSEESIPVERTVFIEAEPEIVFGFLVDPTLMAEWFGISHVLEAKRGGNFRVEVSRGNVAIGVFTEVTPYRRVAFAFTWGWEAADTGLRELKPGTCHVEIELHPHRGGTLLRLVHSGLPKDLEKIHRERWALYLERLALRLKRSTVCEGGSE
jgi:uncharacterized protein YndB with AHSA1/START domain